MKRFITLSLALFLFTAGTLFAQNGTEKLKTYVNSVGEKVEEAESAEKKRQILNSSLDKISTVFQKVEEMGAVSEDDQADFDRMKADIQDKKNELNGEDGYKGVADRQLNSFAQYVQQDMEQADPYVTVSVSLLVLIAVLLLLL